MHRLAQAHGVVRPLDFKLFSCRQYALDVRRYLLRSLAVSKYTHGCVALKLCAGVHKPMSARGYLAIWRALRRRAPDTRKSPHCYEVLLTARAPPPHLMMAFSRAAFLQRHCSNGPSLMFHYLQHHWECDPECSWLHQLVHEVRAVVQCFPAAKMLLESSCTVRAAIASFQEEPRGWQNCTLQARKAFQADLQVRYEKASDLGVSQFRQRQVRVLSVLAVISISG